MLEEIKKEFDKFPIKKILYDTDEGQTFIAELIAVDKRNLWQFIEQKLTEAIKQAKIVDYLEKQKEWSSKTFGNGKRTLGIIKHIQKELIEIEECPEDLQEWIDVIILAMDGYWRHGGNAKDLMERLIEKQCINFNRDYPFPTSEDLPSEHIRINELKGDK